MKLTDKQIKVLEKARNDRETYHLEYDSLLEERLKELDPEFMKDLEILREKHEMTYFWYA